MKRENVARAILFADICGSTRLYEVPGDESAQALVTEILARFSAVASAHSGTVVKTIGDEVNVAARLVPLAKPRQILTTGPTLKTLRPELRDLARAVDRTTLRGKTDAVDIGEILWDTQDMTVESDPGTWTDLLDAETGLEIRSNSGRCVVDSTKTTATLGRGERNDLRVEGKSVSRLHARVEYRRGWFVLEELSSNGTYISSEGKAPCFVHRDEALLEGTGYIGLGEEIRPGRPETLRFETIACPKPLDEAGSGGESR